MSKELIEAALKAAFEAQVSLLFKNLCDGIADEADGSPKDGPDARRRFLNGRDIACLAYEEMMRGPT